MGAVRVIAADRSGWDRTFWGVVTDRNMLLGRGWDEKRGRIDNDEPTRPLLFRNRSEAREWCKDRHAFYGSYPDGHVCRSWRFRVVRVRERHEV